jgi:hypothetical protein
MERIIYCMENLPRDPRVDNPLCISNKARIAGVDYLLIDPEADDHPGSKTNAAVEHIYGILRDSVADRGTQFVFFDLYTPKVGFKAVDKPVAAEPELFFDEGRLSYGSGAEAEPE